MARVSILDTMKMHPNNFFNKETQTSKNHYNAYSCLYTCTYQTLMALVIAFFVRVTLSTLSQTGSKKLHKCLGKLTGRSHEAHSRS